MAETHPDQQGHQAPQDIGQGPGPCSSRDSQHPGKKIHRVQPLQQDRLLKRDPGMAQQRTLRPEK